MKLDPFVRNYQEFMDELVAVLESERTRFYLDTSLLMWLIRLGSAARADFLGWCDRLPANSVKVPVWAAHELHHHLVNGTVRKNVHKTVADAQSQLDDFVRLASERADDELCQMGGYSGRQSFIAEAEQTFAKIKVLAKVVSSDHQINAAADEVISFVNAHMLDTDVVQFFSRTDQAGEFRYSHRVPPGYHDKKDENRFGDVMIWEEMLADIWVDEGVERRHGVLISRDEKTDWVSSAPLIRAGQKPPQKSNRDLDLDVTRAHPLLVHEFKARARGGSLYIVPPSFLASALDYSARKAGSASLVLNLLAAAHRPDLLPKLAGAELSKATTAQSLPSSSRTKPAAAGNSVVYSYSSVTDLMRLPTSEEAEAYLQAIPLDQPSIVQSWRDQLISGLMASERFGRLLAELCLRGRSEWLTWLPSVVEELRTEVSSDALQGVVLGASAPAYFDVFGEARRHPRKDLGLTVLMLEANLQFAPAFAVLAKFLAGADVELPYVPGSGRHKVRMSVDAAESSSLRILRDVRISDEAVLVDTLPDDSPDRLSVLLSREHAAGCTGQELRALLSRQFLVPAELLSTDYDTKRFTWLPDAGLVSLDTASPGGVSATTIEEEDERG